MNYYEYENFDDAFYGINREFLVNPDKIVDYLRGAQSMTEDLIIKVKNPVTSINLNKFAFDPKSKWNHLVKSYIDPEIYWNFWSKIGSIGGTSYQMKFKDREGPSGPCLSVLILTREDGKDPWARAKIVWRNTELNRKFAADLVLIYHFLMNPPEEYKHMLDIESVTLYFAQAFQSWRLTGPLVDNFAEWDELPPTHPHTKRVLENHNKVFASDPQPTLKFAPVVRMQAFWLKKLAGGIEDFHPDELSLFDEIKKIEAKKK